MPMRVVYNAGYRTIVNGYDPSASHQQIQLGRFDFPHVFAQQQMNRQVDIIVECSNFGRWF
jgi:hypothetical protein